jgi:hypothetical protein
VNSVLFWIAGFGATLPISSHDSPVKPVSSASSRRAAAIGS